MLSTLEADRTRLAVLTAQILELEKSLSALRLEQADVDSRLASYKYPVLTLPTEIITEIFIRIPPRYPGTTWLAGPLSPTPLTQISREWRQIALSIPSLWRALNLTKNGTPIQQRAHTYDLWLQWSRSSPLSLEFDSREEYAIDTPKVMALFAPITPRLEHLKLVVSRDDLGPIEGGSMPLLHHLDLDLMSLSASTKVSFGELPLLRGVILWDLTALRVLLPWAQLTSLVLNEVFLDQCVPILQQASNLIHCKLHLYCPSDYTGVATLPCLETLVLELLNPKYAAEYLPSFATPALCRLMIPERLLGDEPIRSLMDFMSKSGEKLQDICITGRRSVPKNSYREALQSIPRLSFSQREVDGRISSSRAEWEIESDSDTD
ncbi:hypothetical protein C8R45DRAFT_1023852 [Mycena sanguinolenta]|nr:hypothetical protein C8R45DRAFT_1023852 [Mycena sanguinolenta]